MEPPTSSPPWDLERLRLRCLRADDLGAFLACRGDPAVARYQGWSPMSGAEAMAFIAAHAAHQGLARDEWRQFGIARRGDDRLLGDVGIRLSADGRQAEFGLSIAAAEQGRGYGTECVRGVLLLAGAAGVDEVVAAADARNTACRVMLVRAGMREVATRVVECKGESCTEHVFMLEPRSAAPGTDSG